MSKRNYKELWEQLKVLVIYGSKQRYNRQELYALMSELELGQLAQDPMKEILRAAAVGGRIDGKETI